MFHIAICDDEDYYRLQEKKLIEEYMEKQGYSCQIDLYSSGKAMLCKTEDSLQYDIIFLDISMEEMDGIETAKKIRQISSTVYIVFVTAYVTYALEGYKVRAIRYLLKESAILENSLTECLDTIVEQMNYVEAIYTFHSSKETISIPPHSILYVESRLHKVIFFVMENGLKEYSKYDKLDTIELELKQYGFCRTHQSFLVNMKYATNVERYKISLIGGEEISISKKYYKNVETEYIKQQGEM